MKILIVDDEANIQKTTAVALRTMGHQSLSAYSGSQAIAKLEGERFDAVFLDLRLGEENGLELYDRIREQGHEMPVIVFTAYSSIETAIEATRKGVFDYVQKPFVPEQIRQALKKLEDSQQLASRLQDLETQLAESNPSVTFESAEPAMHAAYQLADKAAKSDANILLLGPSGTGKSVLARRIHDQSERRAGPFVIVHCPSLSKELLESELFGHVKGSFTGAVKDTWGKVDAADGGTLFLDEIGDLPFEIQAKLLRLIQERQYERIGETKTRSTNARILAATNKDLQSEVKEGRFREDLFYRLNVIAIELPGLAHRKADIAALVDRYLESHSQKLNRAVPKLDPAARQALLEYDWPGNLRELNNAIERCMILGSGESICLADLPADLQSKGSPASPSTASIGADFTLQALEDEHIKRILDRSESLESAAKSLGIDTATLYRKRKRLGLI